MEKILEIVVDDGDVQLLGNGEIITEMSPSIAMNIGTQMLRLIKRDDKPTADIIDRALRMQDPDGEIAEHLGRLRIEVQRFDDDIYIFEDSEIVLSLGLHSAEGAANGLMAVAMLAIEEAYPELLD